MGGEKWIIKLPSGVDAIRSDAAMIDCDLSSLWIWICRENHCEWRRVVVRDFVGRTDATNSVPFQHDLATT